MIVVADCITYCCKSVSCCFVAVVSIFNPVTACKSSSSMVLNTAKNTLIYDYNDLWNICTTPLRYFDERRQIHWFLVMLNPYLNYCPMESLKLKNPCCVRHKGVQSRTSGFIAYLFTTLNKKVWESMLELACFKETNLGRCLPTFPKNQHSFDSKIMNLYKIIYNMFQGSCHNKEDYGGL